MPFLMASTPLVTGPEVLDDYSTLDIFAHGWTMQFEPEIITGISWVEHIEGDHIIRRAVCRVRYPRSRWMQALGMTLGGMGGAAH